MTSRSTFAPGLTKHVPMRRSLLALPLLFALTSIAQADEGMWTFNDFPAAKVAKKYGFSPDKKWLEHVQLASAKTGSGCSASFVSKDGLVMTNHHCVHDCIEQLSSATKDYVKDGFTAKTQAEEVKCPELEVDQLRQITDVTDKVLAATKGLEGKAYNDAQKAALSRLEKECVAEATKGGVAESSVRCDVVNLYNGGRYDLYRYRRFQDVRLAFAPEFAIAFFGGDPDNFMFPRYDLDVSFVRVYEGGKPARMDHFFPFAKKPVKEGDLTFTSGTPGRTGRQLTVARLELERDRRLPAILTYLSEYRGQLIQFQERGKEQKRFSNATLFYVENGVKALRGKLKALRDKGFFASKVADENALRQQVLADPKMREAYYPAWGAIERAELEHAKLFDDYQYMEGTYGFRSELFSFARRLVRAADEAQKPNEQRLREYTTGKLPRLEQELFSTAPIYDEFEIFTLTFSLTKMREALGADHPFVRKVLGKESPATLAARVIKGTKLKELATRKQRFCKDGKDAACKKALDASADPLLEFARRIDGDARAVRKRYEENVESVETKNGELIAKARFAVYGTSIYPDATGTHRLSFGTVAGYESNGTWVKPITDFGGAFERHTGEEPFALPASWLAAKPKLELSTPFNFASTNDIIGGNSGSPIIDKNAEIVGLIFDGNIESLGGDYGFDPSVNRAVSVHASALLEALSKIYGATRLSDELSGK